MTTKTKALEDIIRASMVIKKLTETDEFKYSYPLYEQQLILLVGQMKYYNSTKKLL
jgi:hypothetical protein